MRSTEPLWMRLFGITPEQQRAMEMERINKETASQHAIQNQQTFQREPEKWQQIQIVSCDIEMNFYLIDPSILHQDQDRWVVERKGYSTCIHVPKDKYDSIIEALNSHQSILQVNGRWVERMLYPGLEKGGARFNN